MITKEINNDYSGKRRLGDYTSVQEAIDSITSVPETVFIKNGIYKERVEIHKDNITLIGKMQTAR